MERCCSAPPMRLAQLVRLPRSTSAAAHDGAGDGRLVIELGDARLTIEPGADLTAVVTVLALLRGVAA